MAKFKITINIDCENEAQAMTVAKGLQATANKVNGKELSSMLKILEKNPKYVSMAKMAAKVM